MTKNLPNLDKESPAPLYHQIASNIRRRIENGTLKPGDALAPLREAADEWGVHFHTVRHAYAALARDGLVETQRGPRGTRVSKGQPSIPADRRAEDLDLYIQGVVDDAQRRWALNREELMAAISRAQQAETRPVVFVVECSEHQCALHAEEIASQWNVDARAWPLSNPHPPAGGSVIATYFHYNDIRRLWPQLLYQVHFVTINPDPRLLALPSTTGEIAICERDQHTAECVASDVSRVLTDANPAVAILVSEQPEDSFASDQAILLFAPRIWAELSAEARKNPRSLEIRYRFDSEELQSLAAAQGWRARKEPAR